MSSACIKQYTHPHRRPSLSGTPSAILNSLISYLRDEVEDGIAEESRGAHGYEEEVDILVHMTTGLVVFHQRHNEHANQGEDTQQQHHQSPIAIR